MNVVGIETSCDETSAAVVRDGVEILSSEVFSQVALHAPYGGVVPEVASRSHVERLPDVIDAAVRSSGVAWDDLDVVAATFGPGLASSLLVGLAAGKALALRLGKPFVAINHIEAHIYSIFIGPKAPRPETVCPYLCLVVSGGHTCLVRVEQLGRYAILGQTIDDAAGEAFDKGANLLGLGYPGGPVVDRIARGGDPKAVPFPRGRQKKEIFRLAGLNPELCFSYSGVKTSLLYHLRDHPLSEDRREVPSLAASYQEAIVDQLVRNCERALGDLKAVAAVGGVSLNSRLRAKLAELASRCGVALHLAEGRFCADNAAMVAGLAGAGQGLRGEAAMAADACPSLPLVA